MLEGLFLGKRSEPRRGSGAVHSSEVRRQRRGGVRGKRRRGCALNKYGTLHCFVPFAAIATALLASPERRWAGLLGIVPGILGGYLGVAFLEGSDSRLRLLRWWIPANILLVGVGAYVTEQPYFPFTALILAVPVTLTNLTFLRCVKAADRSAVR